VALHISSLTGSVMFGATWQVTTGQTIGASVYKNGYFTDMNLATIASGSEFVVLFSDLDNNSAMTAAVGKVTV
jgi:hypothetical protein